MCAVITGDYYIRHPYNHQFLISKATIDYTFSFSWNQMLDLSLPFAVMNYDSLLTVNIITA